MIKVEIAFECTVPDVLAYRPDMTIEEAEEFLLEYAELIRHGAEVGAFDKMHALLLP